MGSMMGGMALTSWLVVLVIGILLIAAAVALVRMLSPKSIEGGASNIVLLVLAVIGVLALLSVGATVFMHWGMGGMMGTK
jgi:hypothetical protein